LTGLVRLGRPRVGRVIDAVVRAFARDPIWVAMFPDPTERARGTRELFGFILRYAAEAGEVWVPGGYEGAALWLDDRSAEATGWPALRAGALLIPFRVGFSSLRLLGGMGRTISMLRQQNCPGPHRYLGMLGIAPEHQGRGLGTRLLEPMLERCDRDGLPVWLETETERNKGFYQRFGFEVRSEFPAPGLGVRMWGMRREPATARR
jgi:ribosomal protein S18 acetylase RimI-like enzyme